VRFHGVDCRLPNSCGKSRNHLRRDVVAHAGNREPTMFDAMPTKRPHFLARIPGRNCFTLRKCESRFVAVVLAGHVQPQREVTDIAGGRCQIGRDHACAALDECAGDGLTESLCRSGDQSDASVMRSVHRSPLPKLPVLRPALASGSRRPRSTSCRSRAAPPSDRARERDVRAVLAGRGSADLQPADALDLDQRR
jgi:hypothetical protein